MTGFIEWLESQNRKDTKARAVLRQSLAFNPGTFTPAYPFVEPYVKGQDDSWQRKMHYLVAGLWASHWREGRTGAPMPIGKASFTYQATCGSTSIERRFLYLLDADADQLAHRLRQMMSLLKDQAIDLEELLKGLVCWNDERKRTQSNWACDFYRN